MRRPDRYRARLLHAASTLTPSTDLEAALIGGMVNVIGKRRGGSVPQFVEEAKRLGESCGVDMTVIDGDLLHNVARRFDAAYKTTHLP